MYKNKYIIPIVATSLFLQVTQIMSVPLVSQKNITLKSNATTVPLSSKPATVGRIQIKNKIDKESVGYNKFFRRHYPEKFVVKVNGIEVKPNESIAINAAPFEVEYAYKWKVPWGKIVGAKKAKFIVNDGQKNVEILFGGWHSPSKMIISKTKQLGQEQKLPDPKF